MIIVQNISFGLIKNFSLVSWAEINISEWWLPPGFPLEGRYEGGSAWELTDKSREVILCLSHTQ